MRNHPHRSHSLTNSLMLSYTFGLSVYIPAEMWELDHVMNAPDCQNLDKLGTVNAAKSQPPVRHSRLDLSTMLSLGLILITASVFLVGVFKFAQINVDAVHESVQSIDEQIQ